MQIVCWTQENILTTQIIDKKECALYIVLWNQAVKVCAGSVVSRSKVRHIYLWRPGFSHCFWTCGEHRSFGGQSLVDGQTQTCEKNMNEICKSFLSWHSIKKKKLIWFQMYICNEFFFYPGLPLDLGPVCSPGNQAAAWAWGPHPLAVKFGDRRQNRSETSTYVALLKREPSRILKKGSIIKTRERWRQVSSCACVIGYRFSPWSVLPRKESWCETDVVSAAEWWFGSFASVETEKWWKWAFPTAPASARDPVWNIKESC